MAGQPPIIVNMPNPHPALGTNFKNSIFTRSVIDGGTINTIQKAPNFNPRAYAAQSPNTLQFAPAYIYDWLDWGTAAGVGASQYTFFQRAAGQAGVSYEDTNMQQPGNLGAGNIFQVQKVFVGLKLGVDYVTTGTDAALASANALDDYKIIMNRGYLQCLVNSSPQFGNGIAPLLTAAWPANIIASGGIATGNAAALQALAPYSLGTGYDTTFNPFRLNDQLNFNVTINFYGTPPTLPSGNTTTKIGVIMQGLYARPAG